MIRIAICDDNIDLANSIENDINSAMGEELSCDVFYSGTELITLLERGEKPYHIYLLDIEMPQLNGIEAASLIRKSDQDALILFLTGHKEYVYDVFEVLPFRFLKKTAAFDELRRAIDDALDHIRLAGQIYFFQIGRETYQLHYREIISMEGSGRKVIIRTARQDYEPYGKITDIIEQLDKNCFCRTHASYIVNMNYIHSVKNTEIILQDGTHLPISKKYRNEVKQAHLAFLERRCGL